MLVGQDFFGVNDQWARVSGGGGVDKLATTVLLMLNKYTKSASGCNWVYRVCSGQVGYVERGTYSQNGMINRWPHSKMGAL